MPRKSQKRVIVTSDNQSGKTTREVDALMSRVTGLFVHPKIIWNEKMGEDEETNRFTITHLRSAKSIMPDGMDFPTAGAALDFADSLGFLDWDRELDDPRQVEMVEKAVRSKIDDTASKAVSNALSVESRYVVRREGKRFFVIDTKEGETIEEFTHRGDAATAASDLNRGDHLGR